VFTPARNGRLQSPLRKGGEGAGSGGIHPRYRYLPIDTKHFPDLELPIVALFDNLDEALDGWLIKSENYQALNTILPKFRGKVQTIYIDPPFNKEQDADYHYSVKYKDATWITLLENRIQLGSLVLDKRGSIFVRCDYNGNAYIRMLMNKIFGPDNFRNEIVVSRTQEFYKHAHGLNKFMVDTDTLFVYAKSESSLFKEIRIKRESEKWWEPFLPGEPKGENDKYRLVLGQRVMCPQGRKWGLTQEQINELEAEGRIRIENGKVIYAPLWTTLKNNWTDVPGYARGWKFPTENSEILLKRVIESTSNEGDLVMDFFLGSGTTVAVAHKLGRKWLGVEMGEHFYTVVLPRMKRVLFYDKSGISKEKDVRERYNEQSAGGFFKYYELEQFEDALRHTRYAEDDLFTPPADEDPCQYLFLRDLKMLRALEVDLEQGTVQVNLSKLYENIDLPETLSNLTGKWIRRIYPDPNDRRVPVAVEFADGERVELRSLDWRRIKPLIWW